MEKKINIAELLKDCPKGMELDCTLFDDVTFEKATNNGIFIRLNNGELFMLSKMGSCIEFEISKCVIFPKGKITWEGFVPPCKFKVGDRVKRKEVNYTHIVTITEIDREYYGCVNEYGQYSNIFIKSQNNWELIPNKLDISTLKPFDTVLVRDVASVKWQVDIFSRFEAGKNYPYYCIGSIYKQCIPYEGNEHLWNTTDDCDEFYKTWK